MNTEYYLSFEVAKLLQEKGFDWPYSPFYNLQEIDEWGQNNNYTVPNPDYNPEIDLPFDFETLTKIAPHVTVGLAMKWLRDVHHIFITIEIKGDPRMESFIYYKWSVAKYCSIEIERIDNGLERPENYWYAPAEEDETYELAAEAAIKWCLENLI